MDSYTPVFAVGGVDIHKAIGKLPKPKGGWTLPGHNTPDLTTTWINRFAMILTQERHLRSMTLLPEKPMLYLCSMMLITVSVLIRETLKM